MPNIAAAASQSSVESRPNEAPAAAQTAAAAAAAQATGDESESGKQAVAEMKSITAR